MAKEHLILLLMVLATNMAAASVTTRKLMFLVQPQPNLLTYHNGAVLHGDIPVSVLWYGRFTAAQKAIVSDFLLTLSTAPRASPAPSVSQWWSSIHQLYLSKAAAAGTSGGHGAGAAKIARVVLSGQVSDDGSSLSAQ